MEVFTVYIAFGLLLGYAASRIAKSRGFDPTIAWVLTACLTIIGIVPGLICLVIYACIPTRHRFCPHCGERNVHFLTHCRHCGHLLPF